MGVRGPVSELQAAPKQPKRGVSAAQRKAWQLGSPVTDPAALKGPAARGSCELPASAVPPPRRATRGGGQAPIVEASAGSASRRQGASVAKASAPADSTRTSAQQQPQASREAALTAHSPTPSAESDARSPALPTNDESETGPQPSGFSGLRVMAQLESDISPFRRVQQDTADAHAANAESFSRSAEGSGRAVEAGRSTSQESADSVESTSSAGPSMTAQWRSFRQRQRVADAGGPAAAEPQQRPRPLDMRRGESIALERQGIHAERVGRGDHDPHGTTRRIRDVQLDPKAGGIWVERDWRAAEGGHLTDELVLGKILGSGFQAHVYELLDTAGRVAPIVLKAARRGALINDTQREWATGQRLAALGPGNEPLPGIMKIGPAVCRGRKRDKSKGTKLMGMVMERINGQSVDKVITAPDFHDIYYIRDMLHQVFTSLDASQRAFGFHHYDLRLDNVMTHVPDPKQDACDSISRSMIGDAARRQGADMVFKIIDFGLGRFDEYYAADEGADGDLDVGMPAKRKASWYRAPVRWCGSAPEAVHQAAWRGKGDVYHLLFDLSQKIHGRVWLEKDRIPVKRLLSLIQHVCGVKPRATFSTEKEGELVNCLPVVLPVACLGVPSAERRGLRGRRRTFVHKSYLLRWILQLKAWQFPSNPGLTASEVLTSPFFR